MNIDKVTRDGAFDRLDHARKQGRYAPHKFTVIGLCHCGCDDAFVVTNEAMDVDAAVVAALKTRQGRSGTVAAVIPGWHESVLALPVVQP